ncbi:MAG: thymidine phosphorylase [Verrucomicrobiota bacterium]
MNFVAWIEAKRDGAALTDDQWQVLVREVVAGRLPDYQVAAFLMAVLFRGLNPRELRAFTLAMRDSGERLVFPDDPRPVVDKHSTGGVGDKVSLPLAPLLACLGFRVPMISGRGLGITGGTLDKLESIPGFTTGLDGDRILRQVQELGVALAGQTARMVPADRLLYALRDVTGTVPSPDLITASILAKKLAEGLQALVLDVKFGRAAFMRERAAARRLATTLVRLAGDCGVKTRALLTDMNRPLGRAAGNWLEVRETVECLAGSGPGELRELVLECAAHLLAQTGRAPTVDDGRNQARTCLDSGQPLRKWEALLAAQGADLARYHEWLARDSLAEVLLPVPAPRSGFVTDCDAAQVGEVVRDLGAGRVDKSSVIQPFVGVDALRSVGESVEAGAPLARVHAAHAESAREAARRLAGAFAIGDSSPPPAARLQEVIE